MCQVNLKCAFKSSAALYHLASAVGFKKEAEGRRRRRRRRGYCVCVTIPLVAIVICGGCLRKACREIGEDEEGVGWGGEVLLKELYRETELIKLTNKRELFFFFLWKKPKSVIAFIHSSSRS